MKEILNLGKAPKSPRQLREELCHILESSFILDANLHQMDRETREFELTVRCKFVAENIK